MDEVFVNFLFSQSWVRVVAVLVRLNRPCSMREIIDFAEMSPGGVKYLLERLEAAQIINSQKAGNKKLFSISQDSETYSFVLKILAFRSQHQVCLRAAEYCKKSKDVLNWIDKTVKGLKVAKRNISSARAS